MHFHFLICSDNANFFSCIVTWNNDHYFLAFPVAELWFMTMFQSVTVNEVLKFPFLVRLAAIMNYHRLGNLSNKILFLTVLEAGKSKIRVGF